MSTRSLLERACNGEEPALERLFALHRDRLAHGLRRRFQIEHNALEDVVQETLARAFAELDRFEHRGRGSFLAWLFVRATREWQRRLRYEGAAKRDRGQGVAIPEDSRLAPIDQGSSPSQSLSRREIEAQLFLRVDELPESERSAFQLRRFMGLDYEQIQLELSLPSPGAARALVSRAQVRLAESMASILEDLTS